MGKRRDTTAARHAGGWIVLGWVVLVAGGYLASFSPSMPTIQELPDESKTTGLGNAFPSLSIDMNRATESELNCLPGVGPTLAKRIVEYREQHGPFTSIVDLQRIPGVGAKLLSQLRPAFERVAEPQSSQDKLVDQFSTNRRNTAQHD